MGFISGYDVVVDRATGRLDLTIGYVVAGAYYPEIGEFGEYLYSSDWTGTYVEETVPGQRLFQGGRYQEMDGNATAGPLALGLDPNPAGARTYLLSFYAVESTGDSSDDVMQYFQVQSAAYLTTGVTLVGRDSPDGIFPSFDILIGGSGADLLQGLADDDYLDGGAGNDRLEGGDGNDVLDGGDGRDVLVGGAGDDLYIAGLGDTFIELPGGGNDRVETYANALTLGDNVETLVRLGDASFRGTGSATANTIIGGGGVDILDGAAGSDVLQGGAGNDTLVGGLGSDVLDGGDGFDTADYSASNLGLSVNLALGIVSGGQATGDTLISIEAIRGTAFKDILRGDGGINAIYGNDGNDDLRGGGGNDILVGGGGIDWLAGEAGNDRLAGGADTDVFLFGGNGGRDVITDFGAGAASGDLIRIGPGLAFDTFEQIMAVTSQVGADTIIRFDASNSITLLGVTMTDLNAGDFLFI
ncbi:Ca2+-binding RTX toxin-like protein [Sphingomonas zeicaulis]|uniref:calcium-binding protein n=1 Tax=Sphingomonas zeicaulis TaxID=1632740 RepID=UPI003D24263B